MVLNKFNLFTKKKSLKVGTFGMMNNPIYREEPWKESIANRLDIFDVVCLVCGNEGDLTILEEAFPLDWKNGKLKAIYKSWPFPEWSYEELPKHLNTALDLAREQGCDWMIKLDIDTVFHEKDKKRLRSILAHADRKGKWLVSFSKLQFFTPTKYWKKGNIPIAVNMKAPVVYGFDKNTYTDLCQPIQWDNVATVERSGTLYPIPSGIVVSKERVYKTGCVSVYNYDFTFRAYERSVELLYQIEMAHARFWGKGYTGLLLKEISRETSMNDFLQTSRERFKRMHKKKKISQHPRHFQESLSHLSEEQWGSHLWNKI